MGPAALRRGAVSRRCCSPPPAGAIEKRESGCGEQASQLGVHQSGKGRADGGISLGIAGPRPSTVLDFCP
jgi:hypothetical protein